MDLLSEKERLPKQTGTQKKRKYNKTFFWALEPEAKPQMTGSEYRVKQDKIKVANQSRYTTATIYRKETFTIHYSFWQNNQTQKHRKKLIALEKVCEFPDFSTKRSLSKLKTSNEHKKLRSNLIKDEDLDIPKTVEQQSQQNAYDRKS